MIVPGKLRFVQANVYVLHPGAVLTAGSAVLVSPLAAALRDLRGVCVCFICAYISTGPEENAGSGVGSISAVVRAAGAACGPLPITVIVAGTEIVICAVKRFVPYPTIGNHRAAYSRYDGWSSPM